MSTNRHHLWWPRRDYKTPVERKFRGLPCNIIVMDVRIHQALHIYGTPPTKPNLNFMRESIKRHQNKECGCYTK